MINCFKFYNFFTLLTTGSDRAGARLADPHDPHSRRSPRHHELPVARNEKGQKGNMYARVRHNQVLKPLLGSKVAFLKLFLLYDNGFKTNLFHLLDIFPLLNYYSPTFSLLY